VEKQQDALEDAARRSAILMRKQELNADIDRISTNLYNGRITLGMWEEDMRTRLRMYVGGCAVIGKGGNVDDMRPSDWGKVGAQLKKQYHWLHSFAQDVYDNRETVSLRAIQARAHLYAEAGHIMATEIQAGYFAPHVRRDPISVLPWIPGDGSTQCLNRCGCQWVLSVLDEDPDAGVKTVEAVWVLNPRLEHCADCIARENHIEIIEVPIVVEVPFTIGLGGGYL